MATLDTRRSSLLAAVYNQIINALQAKPVPATPKATATFPASPYHTIAIFWSPDTDNGQGLSTAEPNKCELSRAELSRGELFIIMQTHILESI